MEVQRLSSLVPTQAMVAMAPTTIRPATSAYSRVSPPCWSFINIRRMRIPFRAVRVIGRLGLGDCPECGAAGLGRSRWSIGKFYRLWDGSICSVLGWVKRVNILAVRMDRIAVPTKLLTKMMTDELAKATKKFDEGPPLLRVKPMAKKLAKH